MAESLGIVLDLSIAIGVAFVAGIVAQRLRQPVIIGYLLAGMLIGPHTLRLIRDPAQVSIIAELGVALLMFAIGVHHSLDEIRRVRYVAVFGGAIQILVTIGIGVTLGPWLGLDFPRGIFLGSAIALSSTTVVLRILQNTGEIDSIAGRVTMGILIVQDLSVVPMMVILPALAQPSETLWADLSLAAVKAVLFLGVTLFLGTRLVPALLMRVSAIQSRELFLLSVLALCMGGAIGTYLFGLSLAFGAFVGGLLVSESELRPQVLAEVIPLRDVFATVFFVSIGMLLSPEFVWQNLFVVLGVVLAVVVGKTLVGMAVAFLFRYSGKIAISVGLGLAQMGEFSFVLASLGLHRNIIPLNLYDLILASALLTMLLTPWLISSASPVSEGLSHVPLLRRFLEDRVEFHGPAEAASLVNHVVICGFGEIGKSLAQALELRNFRYFVIEYDPHVTPSLRRAGIPYAYGDAGNPHVLARANLERARVLAITVPDPTTAAAALHHALAINPRLDVIVRAQTPYARRRLAASGAAEVVEPKFEAALEVIRHTLLRFGVSSTETQYMLNRMREEHRQDQDIGDQVV